MDQNALLSVKFETIFFAKYDQVECRQIQLTLLFFATFLYITLYSLELNKEYAKVRADIKEEIDKLRRFETAAQILVGNQQTKNVQEIHDEENNSVQA